MLCPRTSISAPVLLLLFLSYSSHQGYAFVSDSCLIINRFQQPPPAFSRSPQYFTTSSDESAQSSPSYDMHNVGSVVCREVSISVDEIGPISILEATAESQEDLVNAALVLDDEDDLEGAPVDIELDAGDPYGSVLWPAASAVANHLMKTSHPSNRQEHTLLELGAGTGLVSIAAAKAGYGNICATDYESVPLQFLEYAATELNGETDLMERISTSKLDICDFDTALPDANIVVAADIMYEPATGKAAAHRTVEALKRGSRVVIGCSPGRPGRPMFLEEIKRLVPGIDAEFKDTQGTTCSGPRNDLICGKGSTSVSEKPQMLLVAVMDLDPTCIPVGN